MACYHPMPAVRLENGEVSMHSRDRERGTPLQLPCGSCIGCRADLKLAWSVRCQHEAQCHEESCVLTLTYDEDHLPTLAQLQPRHLQLFLKKLRKHYHGRKLRFFAVGEYGDTTARPHYHMLVYGLWPVDAERFGEYFKSATIDQIWSYGHVTIDRLTPQSCSYVAGYSLKKIKQRDRRDPVELIDPVTGECVPYQPPFLRMSNRPGIGALWFAKYGNDLKRGYLPHGGKRLRMPRYYAEKLKKIHPEIVEELSGERSQRELDRVQSDPTYDYRRSQRGREVAELVAAAKRRLLKQSNTL